MKRVLVISPHPDDEAIGCGGVIREHVLAGDTVEVIFLTSGEKGGHGKSEQDTIRIREAESAEAKDILGIKAIHFWREPDGNFQANPENVARLVEYLGEVRPDVIYVPHNKEEHPDHRAAAELVGKSVKAGKAGMAVAIIWMYEVWTPLQGMDRIVDISSYLDVKRKAIQAYACQCTVLKFDEAILGLNRYRGEMHSWPGGDYAEVFAEMKI